MLAENDETMTHRQFKRIAERLLAELPSDVRGKIGNVAIVIEDKAPPDSPDLMGLFLGVPYGDGDPMLPNQIVLYKENIEAECGDESEVPEEIRITLLHEIGHFLGLDENDLAERGLE